MFRTIKSWMTPTNTPTRRTVRLGTEALEQRVVPALSIPQLASNPGAPHVLYIDFDGMYVSEWGYDVPFHESPGQVPPFDIDGQLNETSPSEILHMVGIFQHVAEDYAPFDVNVTTIDPGYSPRAGEGVRIIVGGHWNDWLGDEASGVSLVDDFHDDSRPKGFVFSEYTYAGGANLANLQFTADTVSHEAGHMFGLEHQSRYVRIASRFFRTEEYHTGTADRNYIMGNYNDTMRTTWHNGTYSQGAGSTVQGFELFSLRNQDDMRVLGDALGWRADDHPSLVTLVGPEGYGNLYVGTGTTDLGGLYSAGTVRSATGIIGRTTDTDTFKFLSFGGTTDIRLRVAGEGTFFLGSDLPNAANLDAKVVLEVVGTRGAKVLGTYDPSTLGVSQRVTLPWVNSIDPQIGMITGEYRLHVRSHASYGVRVG
jgi:hypothetical protein